MSQANMSQRPAFSEIDDFILLKEVLKANPYAEYTRWLAVQENVKALTGKQFDLSAIQARVDFYLQKYKLKNSCIEFKVENKIKSPRSGEIMMLLCRLVEMQEKFSQDTGEGVRGQGSSISETMQGSSQNTEDSSHNSPASITKTEPISQSNERAFSFKMSENNFNSPVCGRSIFSGNNPPQKRSSEACLEETESEDISSSMRREFDLQEKKFRLEEQKLKLQHEKLLLDKERLDQQKAMINAHVKLIDLIFTN